MSKEEKCPRCKVGFIQRTALTPPDKGEAIGCTRCTYPVGEPGLSYNPLEVDEGWEPPYRNKNACFEQKLAKEIGEMSDEAVEAAVKKYLPVLSDKEMRDKVKQAVAPMWHNIDALQKELEVAQSLHKVAVRERDYERTLCDNYKDQWLKKVKQLENFAHFTKVFFLASTSWKTTQEQR
jgi:hypothetical protein